METPLSELIEEWSQVNNELDELVITHPNISLLWKECLKHKMDLLKNEINSCRKMVNLTKSDMPDISWEGILLLSFIPFHVESCDA